MLPDTIRRFWDYQQARGAKPQAVWQAISTGGMQPVGYCIGWAVSKRYMQKQLDRHADRVGGSYKLVRVSPC